MQSARVWETVFAILWLCCSTSQQTYADDIAVIESHVPHEPASTAALLGEVRAELERLGYTTRTELRQRILTHVSRPGHNDQSATAKASRLAKEAREHWLHGEIPYALEKADEAIRLFGQNPASFAANTDLRQPLLTALVVSALANKRLRHPTEAASRMAEVARSFPDIGVSRADYGPEAHALYSSVRADMRQLRPSHLRVTISDNDASIFINERYVRAGKAFDEDVIPGRYRVYSQRGTTVGRLHIVEVAPAASVSLSIDWPTDAALVTDDFVGLRFQNSTDRANLESAAAMALARNLGMDEVVVLSVRDFQSRRSIVGTVLSLDTGRPERTAAAVIEPTTPSGRTLRGLARFLAGGDPVPGLLLPNSASTDGPAPTGRDPVQNDVRRTSRAWRWAALTTGVAAVATGVTLIAIDGPILDEHGIHTPNQYDTKLPGTILAVSGVALVGTGILLWLRGDHRDENPSVSLSPSPRGGLIVTYGGPF